MRTFLASFAFLALAALCAVGGPGDPPVIRVAWDPNSEPDLAGYRIHYGTESGNYTTTADVGNKATFDLEALTPGQTYFSAVTAYNTSDLESGYSNEIQFTVPDVPPPPQNFRLQVILQSSLDGEQWTDLLAMNYDGPKDAEAFYRLTVSPASLLTP